jgi:hypothetical protein
MNPGGFSRCAIFSPVLLPGLAGVLYSRPRNDMTPEDRGLEDESTCLANPLHEFDWFRRVRCAGRLPRDLSNADGPHSGPYRIRASRR